MYKTAETQNKKEMIGEKSKFQGVSGKQQALVPRWRRAGDQFQRRRPATVESRASRIT